MREMVHERIELPSAIAAARLLILTGCRLGEIMTLKCEYVEEFAHVLERMLDHCSDICIKLTRAYTLAAELGQLRSGLDPAMAACDTYVFIGGLLKTWLADYSGQIIRERTAELIRNHVALRRK